MYADPLTALPCAFFLCLCLFLKHIHGGFEFLAGFFFFSNLKIVNKTLQRSFHVEEKRGDKNITTCYFLSIKATSKNVSALWGNFFPKN